MTANGSFITSYIACNECLACARNVLFSRQDAALYSQTMFAPSGQPLPILYGVVRGSTAGEVLNLIEADLIPLLEKGLCHSLRMALLLDDEHQKVYRCGPQE